MHIQGVRKVPGLVSQKISFESKLQSTIFFLQCYPPGVYHTFPSFSAIPAYTPGRILSESSSSLSSRPLWCPCLQKGSPLWPPLTWGRGKKSQTSVQSLMFKTKAEESKTVEVECQSHVDCILRWEGDCPMQVLATGQDNQPARL